MLQRLIPHLVALVVMFLSTFLLYSPYFLDGKVLNQSDNVRAHGMQAEINKYEKDSSQVILWTQSMFSGMPTYQIKPPDRGNYTRYVLQALMLYKGMAMVPVLIFMAMFCTYFLLIVLGVDWRLAIAGSLCYGLSTFYCDIADAGHSTKMMALGLLPGVFMGAILTLRSKYLLGGALFGLFLGMELYVNHIQITYYGFIILGVLCLIKLWHAIKIQQFKPIGLSFLTLAVAGLLGLAANASRLMTTYEYSKETIRGKSELASKAGKGEGLDENYAFDFSYSLSESMSILVPNIHGGGVSQTYRGTKTYERVYNDIISNLNKEGYSSDEAKRTAEQQVGSLFYWGGQPWVGVAIYFGAVICFLFVMGMFLIQGPYKIWLALGAFITLMIAWGNHFFVNDFLFKYFPMFNKFRAVSMSLGISQLFFVLLAIWGLQELMNPAIATEKKKKALIYAAGIAGGISLLILLFSAKFSFDGKNDSKYGADLVGLLKEDRASLLRADAMRSIFFIGLSFAAAWLFIKGKLKSNVAILGICLLAVLDIWMVDKRSLYPEKFESPTVKEAEAKPAPVDVQIQNDKDPYFRVLDLRGGNPFTNAGTSFFHKSLGGYHAAKLMLYQELIEKYLSNPGKYLNVLSMLNAKYIIQGENEKAVAIPNPQALGNAWFVRQIQTVPTADAELDSLGNLNPKLKAIVRDTYKDEIAKLSSGTDSSASISLTHYNPDKMTYKYKSGTDQLAVFSEVYYPPAKGWKMKLDGKPYDDFFKVNYLLRGLVVPSGEHTLEMSFEPKSFFTGEAISKSASILLLILTLASLIWYFWKEGLPEVAQMHDMVVVGDKPKKAVPGKGAKR